MVHDILAIGHDVVDVDAFAQQLKEPGEGILRLFSQREIHQSRLRGDIKADSLAVHLAARWAGKEAVLKAWSSALGRKPAPFGIDDFPWACIEILQDARARPLVNCAPVVEDALARSLALDEGIGVDWLISLSHDGPIASSFVVLRACGI